MKNEIEQMYRAATELSIKHAPSILRLAAYGDDIVYSFRANERFTRSEHNQIISEVAHRLEADGYEVQIINITFDAYVNWLADNDLEDSGENRSCFAAVAE